MASPFAIFRKYSTGAMIVLVILSMLVFTFDSLFSAESANLWLLGLLLGGAVFGVAGIKQGRWLQWGIGGAIFGMLLGFVMPSFASPTGIMTSMGEIDGDEIRDLQEQRQVANNVMYGVADAAMPEGLPDQFRQQYVSQIARLFGFRSGNATEDVLFGRLMREEARNLGLSSGTDVVSEYLSEASNGELTASELVDLRERLMFKGKKLNDEQLQEIIGNELDAQLAYNLTAPMFTSYPAPPHAYWDYYKRFNVTQALNLIPMQTDAFLDSVGEPTDAQVGDLFEQYKNNYRNTPLLGDPGFRQYLRARIAYFELPTATAKTQIAAVTDEDVKQWYDDNQTDPLIETTVFEDDEEEDAEASEESGTTDDRETPGDDKTEEEGKAEPADGKKETPADKPETSEMPQKEAATEQETSNEPTQKPEDKPTTEAATNESGKSEATEKPEAVEKPAVKPDPAPTEPVKEATPAEGDCDYQEESETPQAEEPAAAATTPAAEETAQSVSADSPSTEAEVQEASGEESENLPLVIPAKPAPQTDSDAAAVPEQPKFRKVIKPLDDELKKVIRTRLENERVDTFINEKMTAAVNFLQGLSIERATKRFEVQDADDVRNLEEEDRPAKTREMMAAFDADLLKQMEQYAKENGLTLSQTPMLDLGEMVDTDDYPVAKSYELTQNLAQQAQQPTLGALLFSDLGQDPTVMGGQLFGVARRVRDDPLSGGPASHYVAVLSDYSEGHVPTLDEDGVRAKVVLTWKRLEARKKLEERAEKVIADIRKSLDAKPAEGEETKSLADIVGEMTVTGEEADNKLVVRPTTQFSWMRTTTAPQMQLQQRPEISLSAIMFTDEKGGVVGGVRNEFMEKVFNEIGQDEVALISDATKSTYYIAQVVNRYPNQDIGMDGLREEFAEAGKTAFAQNPILDVMREQLGPSVFNEWRRDVWERYGVDLNETP